jgi:hypothetical protein
MADIEVIKWNKVMTMSKSDIIRFQLIVHCYVQKIYISSADLDCLTLLGVKGSAELILFCEELCATKKSKESKTKINKDQDKLQRLMIFNSIQSSRNAITRLEELGLIIKEGRNKKRISIHPDIKVQNAGNILVDIKCFSPNKEE